jgi:hypothetical protein
MEIRNQLTAEQTAIYDAIENVRAYINIRRDLIEKTHWYEEQEVFLERNGEMKGLDWVLELLNIVEQEYGIPIE